MTHYLFFYNLRKRFRTDEIISSAASLKFLDLSLLLRPIHYYHHLLPTLLHLQFKCLDIINFDRRIILAN